MRALLWQIADGPMNDENLKIAQRYYSENCGKIEIVKELYSASANSIFLHRFA
jgi:hypothetical protein